MLSNDRSQYQGQRFEDNSFAYIRFVISISCLAVLLTTTPVFALSSPGITFEIIPQNPAPTDDVKITTYFPGGPFVGTHSHTVVGNQISVLLFEDGADFSPNPDFTFTEDIGQLPAGVYQVTVSVKGSTSNPVEIATLNGSLTVGHPVSVPTLDVYGMLILLLSFAGSSLFVLKRMN